MIDIIVFSPPFGDTVMLQNTKGLILGNQRFGYKDKYMESFQNKGDSKYSKDKNNIGNLKYSV